MTRAIRLLPLLLALGCDGSSDGSNTDDTDTTDTDGTGPGDDLPPLQGPPLGNFACVTPAASYGDIGWATPITLDPEKAGDDVDVTVTVLDFQDEEATPARRVSLWYDDVAQGNADATGTVDTQGKVTMQAKACQPVSYLTEELEGLNEAKPTYKAHQVFGAGQTQVEFQSVAISTYRLIPTVLGISMDPTKGIIAGSFYDCSRTPETLSSDDSGRVEKMRARIFKCPSATSAPADCTTPVSGVTIKYFIENFPDRDQPWSSEDGLWGIFNVPAGTFRIEAYGLFEGEERIVGSTIATTFPDSINISNIWAGYADGVKYPADCAE